MLPAGPATAQHELHKLTASDADEGATFGELTAISGAVALVGAMRGDDNGMESGAADLYFVPAERGSGYCFGDGSGPPCPCGNPGMQAEGCANSGGRGGELSAGGSTSAASDDLVLHAANLPPGGPALLWSCDRAAGGGAGLPLGDGLRCAGGTGVRLGVRSPSPAGDGIWSPNLRTLGGWTAGDTRYFQVGYRDARGPCGSSFNLTNGFMVTFSG